MQTNWKVGDLVSVTFYGQKLIGCISELYYNNSLCILNVMNNEFGSDSLTVKTHTLEPVNDAT